MTSKRQIFVSHHHSELCKEMRFNLELQTSTVVRSILPQRHAPPFFVWAVSFDFELNFIITEH